MVDILHRVGAVGSVDDVYKTLSTVDGLAAWWTEDTTGDSAVGGVLKFRFPEGGFDMKVIESEPGKLVLWEVVGGPEEWIGTHVRFDLSQEDEFAILMFRHEGWKEQVPFMNHCSTKWATFLMSLKRLVETGTGEPAPNDVRVSNWH
ncbi:SRPBCC family protein [Kribbella albertanoniae]|uniref:SRPBCC domain-containing protein n=1 Tax=Kribbella albertanoniae TaxID=1266829 RepID=A0A4R4Q6T3_9ACTN|nr:SRPBCC domain-containing protein [Kribbella albertanoniae]TDC30916.1 SRPBCC domain-containing protein [Kribbella albertanoniae]